MKQTSRHGIDRQKAAATKLAAQRKKVAIAVGLIVVMAVLWGRIFVGKAKPKSAVAAADNTLMQTTSEPGPVFTELLFIQGRHDVLANDVFSANGFKGFALKGQSLLGNDMDITADTNAQSSGVIAAAEQMELIAIVDGEKPQVYIEDKLLEVGQSFKFLLHERVYVFKVVNIYQTKVELECNGIIVTKKIPDSFITEQ